MSNRPYPCHEGSSKFGIEMPRTTHRTLRFPESFSRTSPLHDDDPMSDASVDSMTPPNEREESYMFPMQVTMDIGDDSSPPPHSRPSRSSIMKLENILNDVSICCASSYPRSSSRCESPTHGPFEGIIFPVVMTRSVSPVERVVKKKKVKMHKCPECQKDFPRPSGLRTHMNMHTKEKPFACTYPGCKRSFSVVSNAKRHMRTHGVGVRIEDHSSESSGSVPYVVGFEAPVIVSPAEADVKEPLRLRWVPPASSSAGSGSGTSSIGSSRARSLSGARAKDAVGGAWKRDGPYDFPSTGSEMESASSLSEMDSPPWTSTECFSNRSSPSLLQSRFGFQ